MNWRKEIFRLAVIILICGIVTTTYHFLGFEKAVIAYICIILTQLILPKRDDF